MRVGFSATGQRQTCQDVRKQDHLARQHDVRVSVPRRQGDPGEKTFDGRRHQRTLLVGADVSHQHNRLDRRRDGRPEGALRLRLLGLPTLQQLLSAVRQT